MSTNELVKVILVDACFIVELFCQKYHKEWTDLMKTRLLFDISLELLLLENQVPFFILEKLYNLAYACHDDSNSHSFLELSINFFEYFKKQELVPNFTTCHFTDLLRTFHLQNPSPNRKSVTGVEPIPTATAFGEAGGKFKTNESKCILDWQFSRVCFTIPNIELDNTTQILFRNMVALKQCHYPDCGYMTDYVWAMDFIINTVEYVDILNKNGILIRLLGDDDAVAKMFNSLATNVLKEDFNSQHLGLFKEMNAFYNDGWHQMRATLK
ncbi:hypothetical protein L6164_017396 [Bauhinia variegata]|uniref:Uncharacterized protein n=1 Tax=Bauhinia variegata TaxID=167791 RepID=A0ACB9N9B6_BAUVA|nr:hypothetical protein L6164_017396 [Bauhinia variegata]